MTIFFWKASEKPYGVFCQWAVSPFVADGIRFPTAEHYMMYHKAIMFKDAETAVQVLKTRNPRAAKALGRKVTGFDDKLWREERYNVVLNGSRHKFSQDPALMEILLSTKGQILCEASPFDRVWGIGYTADQAMAHESTWGENLLGKALIEVRDCFLQGRQD